MSILVFGGRGQLGLAMARSRADVVALGRAQVDITVPTQVLAAMARHRPVAVVNAAAFTDVDRAERQRSRAFAVNAVGAEHVALACAAFGVPLIHLSTDYVFDGRKGEPYLPGDAVHPLGVYGASKALGETMVRQAWSRSVVLRTSWVLSLDKPGFSSAVLARARAGLPLRVVADARGQPTPAPLLAEVVGALVDALPSEPWGTWHAGGQPSASWHEVAVALVRAAGLHVPIGAIPVSAWPTAAARPLDARLDTSALQERLSLNLSWQDALRSMLGAAT